MSLWSWWRRRGSPRGRRLLVDAVLIALAANLGNLLDRAPGRTIKCALIAYMPLAIVLGTEPGRRRDRAGDGRDDRACCPTTSASG